MIRDRLTRPLSLLVFREEEPATSLDSFFTREP
jgi:hypothetical protein